MKQLKFLILGKPARQQCAAERLENIRNKEAHKKNQRPVNQGRERDLRSLEKPTNGSSSKSKLARMVSKVAGVGLVRLPKVRSFHRPVPKSRVPGIPVGVLGVGVGGVGVGGGGVGGGGGGSVLLMSFSLANVEVKRGAEDYAKEATSSPSLLPSCSPS
jgi:hypothetical protein